MRLRFSTITEAGDYLLHCAPEKLLGQTYTLGRMIKLMKRLGNPQNEIPAVHVAGTSGKTSTSYYIRALLQAHGKRTGLTSSPHIRSISERVQVDGVPLSDESFLTYLEHFLDILAQWDDIEPTYFELLTAFAFWTFKQEQVDYIIVEVGLGGLLDATNVMARPDKISVITPIGLDHTEILGRTVDLIARQKAGIINEFSDVFVAEQDENVLEVVRRQTILKQAHLHITSWQYDASLSVPSFQQQNFSVARDVVAYIAKRDGLPVVDDKELNTVISATPPGRFEIYKIGSKTVILDGAHNPQKLDALMDSLQQLCQGPYGFLVGFISAPDQKIDDCLNVIVDGSHEYIATEFSVGQDIKGRKSVPAMTLMAKILPRTSSVAAQPNPEEALRQLLATDHLTVVVTGSLYLVAMLREQVIQLAKAK